MAPAQGVPRWSHGMSEDQVRASSAYMYSVMLYTRCEEALFPDVERVRSGSQRNCGMQVRSNKHVN
jgi:hypothetical protein